MDHFIWEMLQIKVSGTEKCPNLSALVENQGQIHPTWRHINCAALILFAYAVAVLEGVCGLKEPYVGTLISVNMMTKMLRWTKTSGLSCCSASQMCQEGGLELSAHGIRQLPLIKGIHNLSWKTSRCIHNCTSGSWKWKHEDESRAGQKDITTLLEFPQSWQLA